MLYQNSVSACGCLIYKIVNNRLMLLLIKYADPNWPRLDDFGGQIDETDLTVFDAICRETSEETNGVINEEYINDLIENDKSIKTFYNKQSKYFLMLMETNKKFCSDTSKFGNIEVADKIKRQINWYNYSEIKNDLSFRLLNNKKLIEHLDIIEKTHNDS